MYYFPCTDISNMENKHGNTTLFLLFLCHGILTWNVRAKGLLSFLFFFKSVFSYVAQKWKTWMNSRVESSCEGVKQGLDYIERGLRVCKEDVVLVMEKLGMIVECECDGIGECAVEEIEELFDEDVTLSEVEAAFDVFDENKDGFIEARELQRVLCSLGLEKDLMECQKMINAVDKNGDELVDRTEFQRIMEQSFG
ncbi:probable calcium-binding protein CML30 [Vigna unguiculata]|uniref:probable calcium-binding protein CML30 n=1 Tax=Vigna unguiculata TaxID=3917 RepID=UPI001016BBA5|nr:probable calcium-binding protein CML30 [Vigna unguiculata]